MLASSYKTYLSLLLLFFAQKICRFVCFLDKSILVLFCSQFCVYTHIRFINMDLFFCDAQLLATEVCLIIIFLKTIKRCNYVKTENQVTNNRGADSVLLQ